MTSAASGSASASSSATGGYGGFGGSAGTAGNATATSAAVATGDNSVSVLASAVGGGGGSQTGFPASEAQVAPRRRRPEAALTALAECGHYPINHTVVIKDDVLIAYPNLAEDAFAAFAEAKRGYIDRLKSGRIVNSTAVDKVYQRVVDIKGDPLPYGIEPNRQTLDDLIRHARMQHIITRPVTAEQLFVPSTLSLVA